MLVRLGFRPGGPGGGAAKADGLLKKQITFLVLFITLISSLSYGQEENGKTYQLINPEIIENANSYIMALSTADMTKFRFLDKSTIIEFKSGLKVDFNENNAYDVYEADTFIDKVELNNTKLTLKCGMQYKIPEPNITIGLNLDYTKAVDYLKTEQDNPVFKAKLAIKFGF